VGRRREKKKDAYYFIKVTQGDNFAIYIQGKKMTWNKRQPGSICDRKSFYFLCRCFTYRTE